MGTPITAYGGAALTGYANASVACTTAEGGTLLIDAGGTNLIQLMDDGDVYFLAKNPGNEEGLIYNSDDEPDANGFANGQVIYLPAQTLSPAIGGKSEIDAGYYTLVTVEIEAASGGDPAINAFKVGDDALLGTTQCYAYGTDEGANKVTDPEGTTDGPLINRFTNINTNYGKIDGMDQVPFSLQVAGPFSLKRRGAYKVSSGDPSDEV